MLLIWWNNFAKRNNPLLGMVPVSPGIWQKKIWTQKNLQYMDLLSSLFWADETWLSAKPPFKVVTNHQPPNRPWLRMSHVASWHQVGCRHPDHSASLWWPLPGRKSNRCGWNGGVVFSGDPKWRVVSPKTPCPETTVFPFYNNKV